MPTYPSALRLFNELSELTSDDEPLGFLRERHDFS